MVQLHGFIGNRGAAAGHEGRRQFLVGGEVEVGEERLARPQHGDFHRLGLLDLHDQVRCCKDFRRSINDAAAGLFIFAGKESGSDPCIAFHENSVAVFDELPGGGRREGHAVFLGFDFTGDADDGLFHAPQRSRSDASVQGGNA